jgi:hypothetical protein
MNKFCCAELETATNDERVPLMYTDFIREFALVHIEAPTKTRIIYCPWCRDKLPDDLLEAWGGELEKVGIFDPFGDDRDEVPPEFWTAIWWLNRGL